MAFLVPSRHHATVGTREAFVFTYSTTDSSATFATVLDSFANAEGLPFADLLPQEQIETIAQEEGVSFANDADDVYTPSVVLWAFLAQCLSASKSCVSAVARVLVLRVALGLEPCSSATSAYCKARRKLPERFLQRLTLHVGTEVERLAPDSWRWKGRRAILVDGTECSMPDTPANQKDYPQPSSQTPGVGFPLIRLVVLLTLASGSLVGCAMGPHQGKESGETSLLRDLLNQFQAGDVLVADRYYCSYWLVAMLLACDVAVAFRLHARRKYDFRRGKRLGRNDHVVTWRRPARPEWMDEETYQQIPETLTVREVRVSVETPGCRSRSLVIATTMTDDKAYPKQDIADLYHKRWHVELDIRNIKQTLKMDVLSCKSPEMVRKEIWTHLLAYNLVRKVMAQAALEAKTQPRRISFAGAVQTLNAFRWVLLLSSRTERGGQLVRMVLLAIATHVVGDRPGRCEPRKVKRRPKAYPLMTRPRAEERAEALAGCAA
jgi:hypothetical protein